MRLSQQVLIVGLASWAAGCAGTRTDVGRFGESVTPPAAVEPHASVSDTGEVRVALSNSESRLAAIEARLEELDSSVERFSNLTARIEESSRQARELLDRIERLEGVEQLGKYGTFLVEHRDRLTSLLAAIEGEYRQVTSRVPGLLRAREIQIVNQTGEVVATVGEDAHGAGMFRLFAGGGEEVAAMGVAPMSAGGQLILRHIGGQPVAEMWVDPSGAGNLRTGHRDGGDLVRLLHDEIDGQIEVYSAAGPAVAIGVVDGTDGTIETWDHLGQTLIRLGSSSTGGGAVTVFDGHESPVVRLRAVEPELGKVDVLGPNGRSRELRP
ncbi:MAG: hypothetical protein KDC38_05750 [Planctomycetes bacterium]|nr:hypothetical protein [Planctomycetota bacterium]